MSFPTRPTSATLQSSVIDDLDCTFLAPMLEATGNPTDLINSAAMTGSGTTIVNDATMGNVRSIVDGFQLAGAGLNTYMSASAGSICAVVNISSATRTGVIAGVGKHIVGDGYNSNIGLFQTEVSSADKIWSYNFTSDATQVGLPYSLNTWMFIALVHDGVNLRVHVNSSHASISTSGNTSDVTRALLLGSATKSADFLTAHLSVHSRALTVTETDSLAANPWQMIQAAGGGSPAVGSFFPFFL